MGLYVALLLGTQNLVLSGYMWAFRQMGDAAAVSRGVYVLYGLLACGFLAWARPRGIRAWAGLAILGFLLVLIFAHTDVPANLLHFVQYGPLTLLVFWALQPRLDGLRLRFGVVAVIVAVSVADEAFQSWIPHWDQSLPPRRFDGYDIFLNLVAALTFLFLLGLVTGGSRRDRGPRR